MARGCGRREGGRPGGIGLGEGEGGSGGGARGWKAGGR